MVNENFRHNILEYLQKNGAANTFKLAHVLEIKRDKLLRILKNLEEQGLIKIITGKAEFLSYPSEKKVKKKPEVSKEKSEVQTLQGEVENQKLYAEKLKAQIKKLEQRPPKVITRTIIKEAKPIKTERKKQRKRKKVKEVKIKPLKPIKAKKTKTSKSKDFDGAQKSKKISDKAKKARFKLKLPKLRIPKIKKPKLRKLKIKSALKLFSIKKFIKHLKKKKGGKKWESKSRMF